MWWASKGPCDLDLVPAFRGIGSGALPTKEIYNSPGEWERIQGDWDKILKGQEFLSWLEDIFDEVRREIRPEAPSRVGNVLVCPQYDTGFCSRPSAWKIKFPHVRNHVYEIDVTGVAITVNSELIGSARQYGAEPLIKYGGGYGGRTPDFYYWKQDAGRMARAKSTIRDVAHEYWTADNEYVSDGLKETIVKGTAIITNLIMVAGEE
jgi:hypothetical protein